MDEIIDEIASLRAAREAEYKKIVSDVTDEKLHRKMNTYKLSSAIKYEAHVRSEKEAQLQTNISTLRIHTSATAATATATTTVTGK